MPLPRLRPVEESDIEAVVAMRQALYQEDGLAPADPDAARAALRLLLRRPDHGAVRIILEDSEPAGYLVVTFGFSLEFGGRDAFVDELYVVPTKRGRGLGTAAVAAAEEICRSAGVRALHLEVERANVRAQALYRRLGFVDHDRYLLTRHVRPARG